MSSCKIGETRECVGQTLTILFWDISRYQPGLVSDGTIHRKPLYLMVRTHGFPMFPVDFHRFSLKQWFQVKIFPWISLAYFWWENARVPSFESWFARWNSDPVWVRCWPWQSMRRGKNHRSCWSLVAMGVYKIGQIIRTIQKMILTLDIYIYNLYIYIYFFIWNYFDLGVSIQHQWNHNLMLTIHFVWGGCNFDP